jgi:hypothetical protein
LGRNGTALAYPWIKVSGNQWAKTQGFNKAIKLQWFLWKQINSFVALSPVASQSQYSPGKESGWHSSQ